MEKQSCEDRIDKHLESRLQDVDPGFDEDTPAKELVRFVKDNYYNPRDVLLCPDDSSRWLDEIREYHQEQMAQQVLCIDKTVNYKVCLSTGGPADFFELERDPEAHEWIGGRYLFQDWFDGASRDLSADQAHEIAEAYLICADDEC